MEKFAYLFILFILPGFINGHFLFGFGGGVGGGEYECMKYVKCIYTYLLIRPMHLNLFTEKLLPLCMIKPEKYYLGLPFPTKDLLIIVLIKIFLNI